MPHFTGNSNFLPLLFQQLDGLAVVDAGERRVDELLEARDRSPLSTRSSKNFRSSARSASTALNMYFRNSSARSASSCEVAKAISGSIIQNSARWRGVLEFSARNVGPKV
jgi:hypothetical protein